MIFVAAQGHAGPVPFTPEKIGLIPGLWPRERRALQQELAPLIQAQKDPTAVLLAAGLHPELVARIVAVPPGPLLTERYAHAVVFAAPFLTDAQRRLFDHLVPGTDGAQRAMLRQRRALDGIKFEHDADRLRLVAAADRALREVEKRFWRIVGYALTIEQRAAIHPLLPQAYIRPPDALAHVYQLPGLTASQASRIQALVSEYESESAADAAALKRAQLAGQESDIDAATRSKRQAAAQEIGDRLADLFRRVVGDSLVVLTPKQTRYLDALPPMLSAADRRMHPHEFIKQLTLRPGQQPQLAKLGQELHAFFQRTEAELKERRKKLQSGEFSAESPQSMAMNMMGQNTAAERIDAMEDSARRAVLGILEPDQILFWIVTP